MNEIISFIFIIIQVIILDGILSLDNAAVLGAIAGKLPDNIPAPLPRFLQFLGGDQRNAALKVGILGAFVGRGLMLFMTGIIINYPLLKIIGAGYLLYLVFKYFYEQFKGSDEEGESAFMSKSGGFWKTVFIIEMADLVFSLDNVIAVVALTQHIGIVIIGVCLSIVIMRFAAMLFVKMIEFEPLLQHAAYVLIFAIAIELILKYFNIHIEEIVQFGISMAILIGFIAYGQIARRFGIIKKLPL